MSLNASIITFLMESLAVEKLPDLVTGQRSVPEEQVLYENELQKLSLQIQERFHILAQLMEKTHQAAAEEDNQAKALEVFFTRKDATQGPLSERVEKGKEKHQEITKLLTESAEIVK